MKDKLEFVSAIITNKEGNVLLLKRKKTLKKNKNVTFGD